MRGTCSRKGSCVTQCRGSLPPEQREHGAMETLKSCPTTSCITSRDIQSIGQVISRNRASANRREVNDMTNGDDGDFLELLGLDRRSFKALVKYLETMDPSSEVNLCGRPLCLSYRDQIATTLLYLGSQMAIKHLCLITGGTPSVISRTVNRLLPIIANGLKHHPDARIKFPNQKLIAAATIFPSGENIKTLLTQVSAMKPL